MLNEPQYIEAARALAERTLREGGSTTDDRLTYMFRLVDSRTSQMPSDLRRAELDPQGPDDPLC